MKQVRLPCYGILGSRPWASKTRENCLRGNVPEYFCLGPIPDNAVTAHFLEVQECGRVGTGEDGTTDTDETSCTGNCRKTSVAVTCTTEGQTGYQVSLRKIPEAKILCRNLKDPGR